MGTGEKGQNVGVGSAHTGELALWDKPLGEGHPVWPVAVLWKAHIRASLSSPLPVDGRTETRSRGLRSFATIESAGHTL